MSKKQPLVNAGKIIERFGGIRPMAAKIEAPVTTVQGWKKRDVIPGTRRAQILSAASDHNIDISDLAQASVSSAVSNENSSKSSSSKSKKKTVKKAAKQSVEEIVNKEADKTFKPTSSVPSFSSNDVQSKDQAEDHEEKIEASAEKKPSMHESLISEIQENNRKNMAASAWIATILILLTIIVGLVLLWPSLKNNKEQLIEQNQQLVNLEDEVEAVKNERDNRFLGASLPEGLQKKFDGLQNQARNISVTVDQLSERAKAISMETLGGSTEAISERLEQLENKIEEMSGPDGSFAALVARIRDLEDSVVGRVQLENSAEQLRSIMGDVNEGGAIREDLAGVQGEYNGGALGRTLEGVSGQDLKAAAILIAFSQFRSSLEREAPFEEDLSLLKKLIGDDNPELQKNLDRLGKHADGGVLTTSGLSSELKKLTGDIVVSSLTGEDVSIKEKAKARFGSIVQIEKDGEMVSGTQTQATVAKAQEYVEGGKIEDSISALQGLDGPASEVVQPFIEKAQAALLAKKVKTMLNEVILSKVDGQSGVLNNFELPDVNMNQIKQDLENAVPSVGGGEIVKDENSGIIIRPNTPRFKGFSGGE